MTCSSSYLPNAAWEGLARVSSVRYTLAQSVNVDRSNVRPNDIKHRSQKRGFFSTGKSLVISEACGSRTS
jgi:hypothetical protein